MLRLFLCMYVCVHNGTVYIYSRISGEKKAKGRRDSMFSARHNIVGFFMCTQARQRRREREGEKRAKQQVNSISCWIFYLYFISNRIHSALRFWCDVIAALVIILCYFPFLFVCSRSSERAQLILIPFTHVYTYLVSLSCSHTRFYYSRVRVCLYVCLSVFVLLGPFVFLI